VTAPELPPADPEAPAVAAATVVDEPPRAIAAPEVVDVETTVVVVVPAGVDVVVVPTGTDVVVPGGVEVVVDGACVVVVEGTAEVVVDSTVVVVEEGTGVVVVVEGTVVVVEGTGVVVEVVVDVDVEEAVAITGLIGEAEGGCVTMPVGTLSFGYDVQLRESVEPATVSERSSEEPSSIVTELPVTVKGPYEAGGDGIPAVTPDLGTGFGMGVS